MSDVLDTIKEGSRLTFSGTTNGRVEAIWEEIKSGDTGFRFELRLHVCHDDGHESFHSFRHDGRSHHEAAYDIASVSNEAKP